MSLRCCWQGPKSKCGYYTETLLERRGFRCKRLYENMNAMIIFIHQIGRDKNTNKLKQTTIVQRMKRCKLHMHQ